MKMTTKATVTHTPGPWHTDPHAMASSSGVDVSVFALTPKHGNPQWIARVYGQGALAVGHNAERNANAALIAAAPAMLGALESLLRVADALISQSEHDIYCEEFSDARAAIAAARGGAK